MDHIMTYEEYLRDVKKGIVTDLGNSPVTPLLLELKRQPSRYQNFEAQSHSLFSRCLRLATTITGSHPRLATGGWLDLTRQAFHLLDYSPLSGRTIPIC